MARYKGPECPWCGSRAEPKANDDPKGERDRVWLRRNPLRCVDCGEVGSGEDWYDVTPEESPDA